MTEYFIRPQLEGRYIDDWYFQQDVNNESHNI